jgi:hypothetical protein
MGVPENMPTENQGEKLQALRGNRVRIEKSGEVHERIFHGISQAVIADGIPQKKRSVHGC